MPWGGLLWICEGGGARVGGQRETPFGGPNEPCAIVDVASVGKVGIEESKVLLTCCLPLPGPS